MGRALVRIILCLLALTVPLMAVAASGDSSLTLSIPSINVSSTVISVPLKQFRDGTVTWDTSRLYGSVGHFEGTAWFGEGGRIVIGGHSESTGHRPDVFYNLDDVQVGDDIIVDTGSGSMTYQVTERANVSEDDLSVLEGAGGEQLVLMTCDVNSYEGGGRYSRRVVIIASRV
jgi:LPXTG-site transpeptidase (sortase) family protein